MATKTQHPPFHAEHIGSLLRPSELRQAFRAANKGGKGAASFRGVQDRCIAKVVELQQELGFELVTDGEFRRASYWSHFVDAVEGMAVKPAVFSFHDRDGAEQAFLAPHVDGRLRRPRPIAGEDFDFLRSVAKVTPKLTMPSPPTMHFWRGRQGVEPGAYADLDEFFADLAGIYRDEIADLSARGARYIQIDEVPLAMLCDPAARDAVRAGGEDPEALVSRYIALINDCLAGRAADLTVGMHLCRGNFKGKWLSEGGYEAVAERLFNELEVDAFFLEYDSARAGDFAPLRHVAAGKRIVLGLISSKSPQLENIDELCRRIDEAAEFLPLDRLAISPQCGFASTVAGNPVTFDDEVNKLRLVVEVARRVWG